MSAHPHTPGLPTCERCGNDLNLSWNFCPACGQDNRAPERRHDPVPAHTHDFSAGGFCIACGAAGSPAANAPVTLAGVFTYRTFKQAFTAMLAWVLGITILVLFEPLQGMPIEGRVGIGVLGLFVFGWAASLSLSFFNGKVIVEGGEVICYGRLGNEVLRSQIADITTYIPRTAHEETPSATWTCIIQAPAGSYRFSDNLSGCHDLLSILRGKNAIYSGSAPAPQGQPSTPTNQGFTALVVPWRRVLIGTIIFLVGAGFLTHGIILEVTKVIPGDPKSTPFLAMYAGVWFILLGLAFAWAGIWVLFLPWFMKRKS